MSTVEDESSLFEPDRATFCKDVTENIVDSLTRLADLWVRIGISGQSLKDRYTQTLIHHENLCTQMYEEDSALYERLVETVEKNIETLKEHCEQLGLPLPEIEHGPPLLMKRNLSAKLEEVEVLRQARLSSLDELRMKEGELCEALSVEPYQFEHENRLPTEEELKELAQHIDMLIVEKEQRFRKYCIFRSDILRLLKILQKEPETALEKDIISEPTDSNAVKLSQHKLSCMKELREELKQEKEKASKQFDELSGKLSTLWDFLKEEEHHRRSFMEKNGHCGWQALNAIKHEINRCQELRRSNLGHFIEDLRKDLSALWTKCHASEEQKAAFRAHLQNDDFSEDLLKIHEEEVIRWNNTYQTFKVLFLNAEKIGDLFQKALEMQQRTMDPNRFHNRGGQLLQEEREKKRLLQLIPKMQKELLDLSRQYENSVGIPFKIGGLSLEEYLHANWELLQQEKENEKRQRKQRKELGIPTPQKQQQQQKSIYGTPGTSAAMKSIAFKSPAKVPVNTTPFRQILRTPNGQVLEGKPSSARKMLWQGNQTPTNLRTRTPVASTSSSHISYRAFERSLNNPVRDGNKRSTINNQKVIGSKRTPLFTNSGAKRKRFSSGRSPRLSQSKQKVNSPHLSRLPPLSSSARGRGMKMATTEIPFLY